MLAPNPGPMTLGGTNTWVVGDPERAAPVVIDPGPDDEGHRAAVLAACGGRVAEILLTHRHLDHSEGAEALAAVARCGIRAADPALCVRAPELGAGVSVEAAGVRLTTYPTPGHTGDSVSLLAVGDDGGSWLVTGDTVLGRGTTVISRPDGDLTAYLASLTVLEELVQTYGVREILPGHGPRVAAPAAWLAGYRRHREERLEQVRVARAGGARTPAEVVAVVYADVDRSVWPAAEQSVAAQLDHLDRPSAGRTDSQVPHVVHTAEAQDRRAES